MSGLAFTLDLTDGITPRLRQIMGDFEPGRLARIIGKSATQRIQMHLESLDQEGNAMGGTRTHYYSDQAGATHWVELSGGVIIHVGQPNRGLSLHFRGGDLGPEHLRNAKHFAIPARAEAHGKVPGDFTGLVMLYGRNGPYALAYHEAAPRDRKDGKGKVKDRTPGQGFGEVLFWLTQHIHFEADSHVLPTDEDVQMAVVGAIYDLWQQSSSGRN